APTKNAGGWPSHTEPPRGTMASPNTVMMIEPVRDGSRLSSSMIRASGCGMPAGIARFARDRQDSLQRWAFILRDAASRLLRMRSVGYCADAFGLSPHG